MAATSPGLWPVSRISLGPASSSRPQQLDLGVGQHPLAGRGRIAVDACDRIDGDDLLPDRPGEDRAGRSERLVGDYRGFDPRHHGADIGPCDGSRLYLAPARQEMTRDQGLGLPPGLVVLLGVQRRRTEQPDRRRCRSPARPALGRRIAPLDESSTTRAASRRASARPIALASPRCSQRGRPECR